MQKLFPIQSYLSYWVKAKSKHTIHSPFVFDFMMNCLLDQQKYDAYQSVDRYRKELLNDKTNLAIEDFGAGSHTNNQLYRSVQSIAKNTGIPKKYGQLLFRMVQYFQSNHLLELGTATGISSLYLAKGNPNATVFSIEGSKSLHHYTQHQLSDKVDNIELIYGQFNKVLLSLENYISIIDLAYIDGHHQKEATIQYFETLLPFTTQDSVFVFDDINWSKGMHDAWEYIKKHKQVSLTLDLWRLGLVFFQNRKEKEHFTIRF